MQENSISSMLSLARRPSPDSEGTQLLLEAVPVVPQSEMLRVPSFELSLERCGVSSSVRGGFLAHGTSIDLFAHGVWAASWWAWKEGLDHVLEARRQRPGRPVGRAICTGGSRRPGEVSREHR